jgi:hypothetical protein
VRAGSLGFKATASAAGLVSLSLHPVQLLRGGVPKAVEPQNTESSSCLAVDQVENDAGVYTATEHDMRSK